MARARKTPSARVARRGEGNHNSNHHDDLPAAIVPEERTWAQALAPCQDELADIASWWAMLTRVYNEYHFESAGLLAGFTTELSDIVSRLHHLREKVAAFEESGQ
jgi:hypothetical protein